LCGGVVPYAAQANAQIDAEIAEKSGGVVLYAAQANAQIDAEIAEKGGLRTETSWKNSISY